MQPITIHLEIPGTPVSDRGNVRRQEIELPRIHLGVVVSIDNKWTGRVCKYSWGELSLRLEDGSFVKCHVRDRDIATVPECQKDD